MLGSRPPGRNTEQHDIFFGIASEIKDLVPEIKAFWPEAKSNLHVDAWREVTQVKGYQVEVVSKEEVGNITEKNKLFFLNLGGYKPAEFDEFHYKMLVVAPDNGTAVKQARQTAFYRHTGFKGAPAHIDDKFGVGVDELYQVKDILGEETKLQYSLKIIPGNAALEDELHLGYFKLNKL